MMGTHVRSKRTSGGYKGRRFEDDIVWIVISWIQCTQEMGKPTVILHLPDEKKTESASRCIKYAVDDGKFSE
jgi:hypothetical protein